MEINVYESDHIVEIWLTKEDKQNKKIKESLKPIYTQYKQQKYKVAVFESGNDDLLDNTAGLLVHNRQMLK
jgi:hypothetical protein